MKRGIVTLKKELSEIRSVSYLEDGEKIEITVKGNSSMPFWKHDLKFEAAIALLETVDEKEFAEDDNWEGYHEYVAKVMEALHIENFRG